jgi:hypothetical protein
MKLNNYRFWMNSDSSEALRVGYEAGVLECLPP